MDESNFHELADTVLEHLAEAIEMADSEGVLEADLLDGVLTIVLPDGNEIVINKHAPSTRIWMSSPASGASYFSYDEDQDEWCLSDGIPLEEVLSTDLNKLAGIELE